MLRRVVRYLLLALVLTGVTTLEGGSATGNLVSRVEWGTPTLNPASCGFAAEFKPEPKTWPTSGSYLCANGNRGNLEGQPTSILIGAMAECALWVKLCSPTYDDPVRLPAS
jgi:hypothetical protein